MPQGRRNRVLQGLRSRHLRILVATDVAARGIDVPTISHVINYGLPLKAEDYVHRIGRTGRAGRSGRAVTLAERRDVPMIRRIQHYTTQPIPVATVEGLEPKRPVPDTVQRPARAGAPRGKFGGPRSGPGYGRVGDFFGGRPGQGHGGHPGGHSGGHAAGHHGEHRAPHGHAGFRPDRHDPRFAPSDRPGFEPRRGDRPEGRDRPFGDARPAQPRFVPKSATGSSKPRFDSNGSSAGKRPRKPA
jgi:superfamily II DNA or RNA helicase